MAHTHVESIMKPFILSLVLYVAGSSLAPAFAAEEEMSVIQNVYICERGAIIPVTYLNAKDGDSYAIAVIEGRQVAMALAPSGSGARYVAINEQESYRWHTRGKEAMLSFLEADHTAEEKTLLTECKAQTE